MVVNGWAVAYRRFSLDYVDEEADAQAARRGIWASEFVTPWEWRRGKRLDSAESEACTACDLRHKRLLKRSDIHADRWAVRLALQRLRPRVRESELALQRSCGTCPAPAGLFFGEPSFLR